MVCSKKKVIALVNLVEINKCCILISVVQATDDKAPVVQRVDSTIQRIA